MPEYMTPDDELTSLLQIYKTGVVDAPKTLKPKQTPEVNLDDDGSELNKFTIQLYIRSITEEQAVIEEMREIVRRSPDPELANSLASLEKSVGDKMKMLAELSMHKGRIISQEKLKANDNAIKKEIALLKVAPPKVDLGSNNTFNITATREEIFKMAMRKVEGKEILEELPPPDVEV